jgi:hypothetical protein
VDFARDPLGIEPIPWQRWLLIHSLELRNGRFRFRTILILVARQNGKTTIIEVKNLWKMFVLQVPLVIGTAQNLDISEESWDKAVEIVESIPELAAEVPPDGGIVRNNGKKALKLLNGSRWKIAAVSRKGGRGLAGDDVNLDELREHLDWLAWGAVTKTTMARADAQVFAYSNAGDDRSVVLNELQAKGRAAALNPADADPTLGHFEWSAPDDVRCTCVRVPDGPHQPQCRLWDRKVWGQANPSLGYMITEQAIVSALTTDPEPIFRTEILCQRVETLVPQWQVIPHAAWLDNEDPDSRLAGRPAYGVYVPPDRSYAAIAAAGAREPGGRLIEITSSDEGYDYRPGAGWVVPRLLELESHNPSVVVIDDKALADEAEAAGLVVHRAKVADVVTGCQLLYDGVAGEHLRARDVYHLGQDVLTEAIKNAVKRDVGGSWAWARRDLTKDVTTAAAASLALFGHCTQRVHRPVEQPFFAARR